MPAETLDARGLKCPIPVLRARKAIRGIGPGEELEVLATDPGAVKDFHAFSEATGHELVEWREEDGEFRFLIRRKPRP
jgi:tRNA 2-thiouridine synthesizing protein A